MRQKSVKNSATLSARQTAYRLVGLQAVVVLVIAACWLLGGMPEALSALLGGAACVIPSLYFARRLFATTSAREAKKIIRAFYLGELVKLALSVVMVVFIIMFIRVTIVPFITGFIGAQFGFWLAPMMIKLDAIKSSD
ncbi:ATP synthase subunit I [Candidiatus Paracoxiella cheracis]|uniref:ATP synthase subunit I n=1 Tax=Candidiatus Paracoxiella cheracis TaxID=3405120 RepID=UPI003BF51B10